LNHFIAALIEVKVLPNQSAKEMYKLMMIHLKKRYHDVTVTKFQQSYDHKMSLLRFDLPAKGSSLVLMFC